MKNREVQRIRDPVHGLIVFGGGADAHQNETDLIAWRLLNTREFQRLRRICQLGFSDLVFPGATHSRFAHSVGVYYVARRLVDVVRRRQMEKGEPYDADRLDYLQRDRLMTGVGFAHFDLDWLLDCLEVGSVTIKPTNDFLEAPCLYLGPKGLQVAEEYLEARFRLYTMVYMHKTTRAAEKMFAALLKRAVERLADDSLMQTDPIFRYLATDNTQPAPGAYLDLDDASVWSAIAALESLRRRPWISELAGRLRRRNLYKCLDVGCGDRPEGNLYNRFRRRLQGNGHGQTRDILFDDASVALYKRYDFNDTSALNKVLVKTNDGADEPQDIVEASPVVQAFRDAKRIQRVYAPDQENIAQLQQILEDIQ